jgi:hypothetical protein
VEILKNSRQFTLEQLTISAYQYNLSNSKVVFSLMGILEEEQTLEIYYKLIELGADLEQCDSNQKLKKFADSI